MLSALAELGQSFVRAFQKIKQNTQTEITSSILHSKLIMPTIMHLELLL